MPWRPPRAVGRPPRPWAAPLIVDRVWASADIHVNAAGLATLASRCNEQATALGAVRAPEVSQTGGQASAAAVSAAHDVVQNTAERLRARLVDTAAKVSSAAATYTSTDEDSAAWIAKVADGLTEV